MNLKEQEYVCTLARCQSITRAAEELYLSPSALSIYISRLEKYLGVRLFERTGKAFILTPIGEEYVLRANKMLGLKAEFDGLVEQELRSGHAPIRVGIQQRRAISVVPETLRRFLAIYPNVEVVFRDGGQSNLVQMYREGAVDFILTIYQDDLPDAEYRDVAREQVLVALSDQHPAASHAFSVEGETFPHLDMHYLDQETFIVPPAIQSMRATVSRILEQTRIRPCRIIEIGSFEVIMGMVNLGLGIGFNRLGYIKAMPQFEHVRYYQIGKESFSSRLVLAHRKGHVVTPEEQCLMDILVETAKAQYQN